jgi:Predicted permeases
VIPFIIGLGTGVLSGFGVGGGTLLLIVMTNFLGIEQPIAQGINLLYFIPAAATSLPSHVKNGFVDRQVLKWAVPAGLLTSALAAWLATGMEVELLRKIFGVFLLVVGVSELLKKDEKDEEEPAA